ncbi:MAG: hypothetical protein GY755_01820 [Chloroflexi bacterium]|nr:hypothetical protein [Chloroflexota bacterium]
MEKQNNNTEVFQNAFELLDKWKPVLEEWSRQITSLVKKHKKYDFKSLEWVRLISEIGDIVSEAPIFKEELENIKLPKNDEDSQTLRSTILQSKKLELLWLDIQNQEYKRLWTITRYSDLIAAD